MKKIKKITKIGPKFYTDLHNPYYNYERFVQLLNSRIKLLRLIEDNITNLEKFDYENTEEDTESHFITRLVCSSIGWTSIWFVNMETKLFNLRLRQQDIHGTKFRIQDVRISNDTVYLDPLSYRNSELISLDSCYVHFSRVSELLASREIKFKNGYGILQTDQAKVLIKNEFRNHLDLEIINLKKILKEHPDERLEKICQTIFVEKSSAQLTGVLKFDDHEKYFPPCISRMIDMMRLTRHLKYNDRQSLCLFLKDLNYPLESTVDYFRDNFQINKQDFDKKYLYNIRHNYGLEGKKANYMCFSCVKIASLRNSENKSSCPFVDDKKYIEKKFPNLDIEDIFKDKRPSGRCKRLVEILTGTKYDSSITTPIKYFITYKENDKKIN
ncbi:hypothetical protein P3W45_001838 [Vairimorpha bombi]|jgi:DNA primase large subunit